MTLTQIITPSFSAGNRSWKMIALLYLVNLLFAAILAAGFHSALSEGFGNSMLPETLLEGFSSTVFNDFMRQNSDVVKALVGQLGWFVLFYTILNTLLGGGIVSTLSRQTGFFNIKEFFSDCGTYVGRFLLLLLLTALVFVLLGFLLLMAAGIIFGLLSSGSARETTDVVAFVIAAVFFLVPMILLLMVSDYAKVIVVVNEERSVLSAFGQSAKFIFGNFLSTVGWQFLMILLAGVLVLVYWFIQEQFSFESGLAIFGLFLLQQVSVTGRIWVKVVTIGGQVRLFENTSREWSEGQIGFIPPVPEPLPPVPTSAPKKPSKGRKTTGRGVKKGAGRKSR